MAEETQALRSEIKDLSGEVNKVKLTVVTIETTTAETNRRLGKLEDSIEKIAEISTTVASLAATLTSHDRRLTNLENTKADKTDVDHRLKKITDELEVINKRREKLQESVKKAVVPASLSLVSIIGTYLATKLGLTDLFK
jgi:chromosome segregation ATPase